MIKAVLFDFAGTLFGRPTYQWLPPRHLSVLRAPGPFVARMNAAERAVWNARDLTALASRSAHVTLFRLAGLTMTEDLFQRLHNPAFWLPYADTAEALAAVKPLKVGVLSNISWDIRRVFARESLSVDAFALSYEIGFSKPSARAFDAACVRLDVDPSECLFVGDDPVADGAAVKAGLRFAQISTAPVGRREPVLLRALASHGIG
ncbi:haloacid dehalogenase superfamily, subfamily IA, variant 3 with third motif having DD or ED/haloacid dehalogenase superfamily, subfamily IA, variant 1 with third motif having Dx(3-4)D or Dx(3-4)E [Lentzea albidocapillata subsp. violacea]|uniref:Haloacid dehalogenase superfamily, subfamily IA, variant 3 with third motif having DD or ED/haloacid dehalogenase superfamily, subfamily IA, variant 1 with third motif having Dx(3-4)D or Dx(3-4)E n=1 Tax=Lentzea albidocapillata subsp. violacea TaxID=128104 RepID=A0A1G9VXT3_9PSEU|nr:HAD family hydrolase [Lentzea albidocapillata]SDM76605.1 haloacid dehalogenase superfamily, subfamily IA, variant 3 with third motif having DD or ED/haloacid dehalogenase superfamily, subfamily IA, variant 1 with third motif having Dx(3-4)D or Dx(3-4)E [Lentzea albidocapillata subsp. violacea]